MRSSKSRSRSKANRPRTLGNIVNRVFDSSGPEGKVRGTPAQIIEKYQFLARDAQLSNDRVAAENFLQHAEHYTRMLAEAMREQQAEQEARQQFQQQNQTGQPGNGGNRDRDRDYGRDGNRDNRYDRPREDRYERAEDTNGGLGPVIEAEDDGDHGPVPTPEAAPEARAERPRFDAPRGERPDRGERQERGERQDRGERSDRGERQERADHRPVQAGPAVVPAPQPAAAEAAAQPKRERRPYPPRARAAEPAEQPGLPSFITGGAEPAAVDAPVAKPKPAAAPRAPRKPAAKPAEDAPVAADTKAED